MHQRINDHPKREGDRGQKHNNCPLTKKIPVHCLKNLQGIKKKKCLQVGWQSCPVRRDKYCWPRGPRGAVVTVSAQDILACRMLMLMRLCVNDQRTLSFVQPCHNTTELLTAIITYVCETLQDTNSTLCPGVWGVT